LAKVYEGTPPRWRVVDGGAYVVHCAVRTDGSSPADAFLEALKANSLGDDPEQGLEPDEQLHVYAWFIKAIRHFADTGEPLHSGAINYLSDGIWEFKRRNKRITFYDTDGVGGYTRKARIENFADADVPGEFWRIPNFDTAIRLGHSFMKA
jgi:hypothetical protein